MLGVFKGTTYPIGVVLGYDSIKMAQLAVHGEEISVVGYKSMRGFAHDPPDCPQWQRWAIDALRYARANGQFRGKDVVAALPGAELFVDVLRCPKASEQELQNAIFSKMKPKLPVGWTKDGIVMKCIPTEQDNIMVIAARRAVIERHLAIYERAHLRIKSMTFWPLALAGIHDRLFAQRQHSSEAVVMLLDVQSDHANIVVCRGGNPLLAKSIRIDADTHQVNAEAGRIVWELTACRKQLLSLYRDVDIERLILLSTSPVAAEIGRTAGAEMGIRVQVADCQTAFGMDTTTEEAQAANNKTQTSLALAFGLSLC